MHHGYDNQFNEEVLCEFGNDDLTREWDETDSDGGHNSDNVEISNYYGHNLWTYYFCQDNTNDDDVLVERILEN